MALIIFSGITAFLTSATLLLSILFFAEYISFHLGYRKAFKEQSKDSNECSWDNLKIAVLVPAHNEEAGIKSTLNSIIDNLKVQDELVVVADNCNDATSEIAYSVGARVLERKDSLDRGKGYALDFGIQHLKSTPPDVVICIDADCQVESDAIENLAEVAAITQRPVQSLYLFKMSDESVVKQQIVAFAIKIRVVN